jgi:hypothetical protein
MVQQNLEQSDTEIYSDEDNFKKKRLQNTLGKKRLIIRGSLIKRRDK